MNLAEYSTDVADRCERMHREDRVEAVGGKEGKVGEADVVNLDVNFSNFSCRSSHFGFAIIRVDGDNPCTLFCECNRRASRASTEFENALVGNFAKKAAIQAVHDAGAELHRSGRSPLSVVAGCRVAGPELHGSTIVRDGKCRGEPLRCPYDPPGS